MARGGVLSGLLSLQTLLLCIAAPIQPISAAAKTDATPSASQTSLPAVALVELPLNPVSKWFRCAFNSMSDDALKKLRDVALGASDKREVQGGDEIMLGGDHALDHAVFKARITTKKEPTKGKPSYALSIGKKSIVEGLGADCALPDALGPLQNAKDGLEFDFLLSARPTSRGRGRAFGEFCWSIADGRDAHAFSGYKAYTLVKCDRLARLSALIDYRLKAVADADAHHRELESRVLSSVRDCLLYRSLDSDPMEAPSGFKSQRQSISRTGGENDMGMAEPSPHHDSTSLGSFVPCINSRITRIFRLLNDLGVSTVSGGNVAFCTMDSAGKVFRQIADEGRSLASTPIVHIKRALSRQFAECATALLLPHGRRAELPSPAGGAELPSHAGRPESDVAPSNSVERTVE